MGSLEWDSVITVDPDEIPDAIRTRRKYLGLSQQELALAANMSLMSIRRYESGERIPDAEAIEAIAEALGISAIALYNPVAYEKLMKREFAILEDVTDEEQKLLEHYRMLNDRGQAVAIERVEELGKIPEYKKEQPPAADLGES